MTYFQQKKILFHWVILFFIGNLFLYLIIGLGYLSQLSWYGLNFLYVYQKIHLQLWIISSYISHLALLGLWPLFILLPMVWICFFPRLIITMSLIISMMLTYLLLTDVLIYINYRFHLNGIIVRLVWDGINQNIFGITWQEMITMAGVVFILSCLQCYYAKWLWSFLNKKNMTLTWLTYLGLVWAVFFYISYESILRVKDVARLRVLLEMARFLPGYVNLLSMFSIKHNALFMANTGQRMPIQSAQMNVPLKYPLHKLVFEPHTPSMNVVIIVLDAWRFDAFTEEITPNIYRLSKKSWFFSEHISGGNATGPGIFSLFYGIPATYWTAMQSQHRSPILLNELQKTHDIKIITSSELDAPPLSKTVFQDVKDVQKQSGATPTARDQQVTQQFKDFIDHSFAKKKPFFTYLLYDSTHSYCETDDKGPFKYTGSYNRLIVKNKEALFARYKNAAYFIDHEVQGVINALRTRDLLKNTILIITADHGEEFDDNGLGYWGHASNYTPYQIKVPLIVYWPGEQPQIFSHQTSHFDIVPTLMTRLLGCSNKAADYSIGTDLLDKRLRLPLIVSSYIDFGILEPARVTRVYAAGNFQVENNNGKVLYGADIHMTAMHEAFKNFTYFN